jgi:hypothetical protein
MRIYGFVNAGVDCSQTIAFVLFGIPHTIEIDEKI